MPRPSNTRERRQQISSALITVMSERGYEGASIGQIARTAGLTQGLVHYHFQSKEEILLSALEELRHRHNRALDAALARAGERPQRRLDAFIDAHLGPGAFRDDELLACWVSLSSQALKEPGVREAYAHTITQPMGTLRTIIQEGLWAGDFGRGDPESCAIALMATIQGYFLMGATCRTLIPRGTAVRETRRMANGLLAPAEPLDTPDQNRRGEQ